MRLHIILALVALPSASLGMPRVTDDARQMVETGISVEETRVVTLDITGMT